MGENEMHYKHCCIVGADGAYKTFCPCVGAGRGWQNGRERPARHPCREQAPDRREPDCHAALCGAKGFVMPFWDSDINYGPKRLPTRRSPCGRMSTPRRSRPSRLAIWKRASRRWSSRRTARGANRQMSFERGEDSIG